MSRTIADLFSKIQLDPWREEVGFNKELEKANQALKEIDSEEMIIDLLSKWIQKNQPCLFGRVAAKLDKFSFCILTESDLNGDDKNIQTKIQGARTKWTKAGFHGEKSGFILFVKSDRLAYSIPDEILLSFTKQLCSYYLLEEIEEDVIYTDEIFLEKPGPDQITWKWLAGVNYFCSNADKRWWQDHRFPGGLAFSVNSVGHMSKAGGIAKVMNELNKILDPDINEIFAESKVDSLEQALEFAMRTIAMASDSISGKATELINTETNQKQTCPISLPKQLIGKDCSRYKGYYHTDITIPSEYFNSDIERPKDGKVHILDFTYLYDNNLKNPDHITMGTGRRIRRSSKKQKYTPNPKIFRTFPTEETINSNSRLYKALNS
jgi:hypothetical protein